MTLQATFPSLHLSFRRLSASVAAVAALWIGACAAALAANPVVEMTTNLGTVRMEVFADKAPKSAANFLQYVKDRFYDGTIFHRVIPGFMIQGGGFTPDMEQKKTREPIDNEARNGLKNTVGTLAMARTSDPHSATAQFFINVADNDFLNFTAPTQQGYGYAVFGRVTQGMDVVNKIVAVPTSNRGPHEKVPVKPVVIQSMRIVSSN
jgi:cyclophilin family peptidyl-prolyl cis-trans isomerase